MRRKFKRSLFSVVISRWASATPSSEAMSALAALVSTLAENGVGVVGLTAQTKNLEEIFLSLTQNNGEVA